MDKVINAAAGAAGPAAQVIEVKDTVEEVVAPQSGFPWGGVGIGVLIVAVVAIGTKVLSD
jgi:hypothetical protein